MNYRYVIAMQDFTTHYWLMPETKRILLQGKSVFSSFLVCVDVTAAFLVSVLLAIQHREMAW